MKTPTTGRHLGRLVVGAVVLAGLLLALFLWLAAAPIADRPPTHPSAIPDSAFRSVYSTPRTAQEPTQAPEVIYDPDLAPRASAAGRAPSPVQPTAIAVSRETPRPSRVSAGGNPSVADAKAYARSALGPTQYACLDQIAIHESHWNPYDLNPTSGAYGIPQALPGSKMAWAGDDWRTNPVTQVRWMVHYLNGRYGSACAAWDFWLSNRWY